MNSFTALLLSVFNWVWIECCLQLYSLTLSDRLGRDSKICAEPGNWVLKPTPRRAWMIDWWCSCQRESFCQFEMCVKPPSHNQAKPCSLQRQYLIWLNSSIMVISYLFIYLNKYAIFKRKRHLTLKASFADYPPPLLNDWTLCRTMVFGLNL